MAELGDTRAPRELIEGDPAAIEENARVLRARAERAAHAGEGLRAIDSGSWEGPAARAFHERFSYEPGKWFTASTALEAGADALANYASTLRWAQDQAAEAIQRWDRGQAATERATAAHEAAANEALAQNLPAPAFSDPGEADRQAAHELLTRARSQLAEAGDIAAGILHGESEAAPEESSWLDDLGRAAADVGASVVNTAASVGNAMLNHPGEVLAAAGGIGLTAAAATGQLAGVALDATGVGAVAGVPLNTVSAAGMAAGVGITGAAMASIAAHAAGDDEVTPIDTNTNDQAAAAEEAGAQAAEPPREITGHTKHGEAQALGRDGGRGVAEEAMRDAVENPIKPVEEQPHEAGPKYRFEGKDAVVVLNAEGRVVTTFATGRGGLRNP